MQTSVKILLQDKVEYVNVRHTTVAAEGIAWTLSTARSGFGVIITDPFAIAPVEVGVTAVCEGARDSP